MHKISVPIMVTQKNFNRELTVSELKRANADRVFLAVDVISFDKSEHNDMIALLRENIPYFKAQGFEVGVWYWTFWRKGFSANDAAELLMAKADGSLRTSEGSLQSADKNLAGFCCPSSEKFLENATEVISEIARLNPDIIMFDDDWRYALYDGNIGCYCSNHMKKISEIMGRDFTREQLYAEIFAEKPNETRTAWLSMLGNDLKNLAKVLRNAVDSVNPNIRLAFCSCMSDWDVDGVDSVTLTKLLAGNTRPLMRLIGAPYWAMKKSWGNRLQNIIELERMEQAWCGNEDIELMLEGDPYPRPRNRCPASYLELFDTALCAAGVGEYTHKYMIDYTSSAVYEKGYIDRHLKNKDKYEAIDRIFGDKKAVGVRVYEAMEKFCDADLSGIEKVDEYAMNMFFSIGARMLADNTVPTTYEGKALVGIAFGENARHLPEDALAGGLILDIRAAKILSEKGIDVGLKGIGKEINNDLLWFPEENDIVRTEFGKAYEIEVADGAEIVTYSLNGDEKVADTYIYENSNGSRFLVFSFDSATVNELRYRNYLTQSLLYRTIDWLGRESMPAKCNGNPDAYILCKKNQEGMAVGLWNCFADEILSPEIILDKEYSQAEFIGCLGELCGNKIKLSDIAAFSFAFVNLR